MWLYAWPTDLHSEAHALMRSFYVPLLSWFMPVIEGSKFAARERGVPWLELTLLLAPLPQLVAPSVEPCVAHRVCRLQAVIARAAAFLVTGGHQRCLHEGSLHEGSFPHKSWHHRVGLSHKGVRLPAGFGTCQTFHVPGSSSSRGLNLEGLARAIDKPHWEVPCVTAPLSTHSWCGCWLKAGLLVLKAAQCMSNKALKLSYVSPGGMPDETEHRLFVCLTIRYIYMTLALHLLQALLTGLYNCWSSISAMLKWPLERVVDHSESISHPTSIQYSISTSDI